MGWYSHHIVSFAAGEISTGDISAVPADTHFVIQDPKILTKPISKDSDPFM